MKKKSRINFCIFLFIGLLSQIGYGQTSSSPIILDKDLSIIPINESLFIHRSWMTFTGHGRVGSNGLIYISDKAAIVMDTPVNDTLSNLLTEWLTKEMGVTIKGVIINHFHVDCLGGLNAFHQLGVPSYATKRCQRFAKKEGVVVPKNGFRKTKKLKVGSKAIWCGYFGKAHTSDNLVVYIPEEQALFGGCMLKSLKAGKGNLNDASVKKWSQTIRKIKATYPNLKIVVPGHGKAGGIDLLDYTMDMFDRQ